MQSAGCVAGCVLSDGPQHDAECWLCVVRWAATQCRVLAVCCQMGRNTMQSAGCVLSDGPQHNAECWLCVVRWAATQCRVLAVCCQMGRNTMQSAGCLAICASIVNSPSCALKLLDFTVRPTGLQYEHRFRLLDPHQLQACSVIITLS